MSQKKKSWREKLADDKDFPKVCRIDETKSKRWGEGTFVIPAPREVDELMRRVPKGKLTTIDDLRKALARKHGATIACPITTGIFAWIAAHAAAEAESEGAKRTTPYWRTLKAKGELNPRYPGGLGALQRRLAAEGHTVVMKRKRAFVPEFGRRLVPLDWLPAPRGTGNPMKTIRFPWSLAMTTSITLFSGPNLPAGTPITPVPRADSNSRIAHEQLLVKAKQGRIDIYFAGDSITRRWGCSDRQYQDLYANWQANLFGWNAANFGWGGDTVQNILWRLENGELEGVNPKVIVLLAGTNNLNANSTAEGADARIDEVVAGIRAILDSMQRQAPRATILLMGILPRNHPPAGTALMPAIDHINERLAGFAEGKRIRYLNINRELADAGGRLFEGMTVDGLHLSVKGYQVWADALKPIFTELLGPPAKEDHAPPPTGDPGAQSKPAPLNR